MNPDTNETIIKKEIRSRMERVVPSRELFEAIMLRVTKEQSQRTIYVKAVPSPYNIFVSRISARSTKIVMTFALTAFIAVLAVKIGSQSILQSAQTPKGDIPSVSVNTSANEDLSPDQIVATLVNDADVEGALGASEEEDARVLGGDQDLIDYTFI